MRNTLNNCILFAVGAAIGSAVTWKFVKTKYERIADEEIDSMKRYYEERQSEPTEGDTENDIVDEEPAVDSLDREAYAKKVQQMEYVDYSNNTKPAATKKPKKTTRPYVIDPDEYGEMKEYQTVSLNYYSDGVLADDFDEVVDDVDDTVGLDSLKRFDEYGSDSVYVRNDERKCDYEILIDGRAFKDVAGDSPYRAEDEWSETR